MQNLRQIVWFNSEIVIFVKVFYAQAKDIERANRTLPVGPSVRGGKGPRPPRVGESVAYGNLRYFRRKAGAPPAYGRRAWSKVVSYLRVFRYVFRFCSEFRRHLENKAKLQKARQNCVGVVENSFFGFKALQRVDAVRCSKNVFWIDCFRWPKGHLKQSKMHVEMKMQ